MTLLQLAGTPLIILLLGVTLLVGFGADRLAKQFQIPDVLWLIGLGLLAGPVLGLLPSGALLLIAPVLGTTALILILFDAGIDLKLSLIRPLAGSAILFAVASYAVSTVALFAVGDLVLFPGHTVLSLLFGAALGCTSGAVIIPLANRLGLGEGLRSLIHLDSAIEDALAIIVVTTLLVLVAPSSPNLALNLTATLVLPLPVGVVIGLAAGLLWLLFLYGWQYQPFSALATLGFLFIVYAIAEALGGSGILAAIVFGGVLGNEQLVRRLLRRTLPFRISSDLRQVEVEIAFVLRTFFLFLIGMLVTLVAPSAPDAIAIILVVVLLLALRLGTFRAVTNPREVPRTWATPMAAFYGRGLTSAVLLIIALQAVPRSSVLFLPALLIIVGTNVAMTIGLYRLPLSRPVPDLAAARRWADAAPQLLALAEVDDTIHRPAPGPTATPATHPSGGVPPGEQPEEELAPPPLPTPKRESPP